VGGGGGSLYWLHHPRIVKSNAKARIFGYYVTIFAPHKVPKSIATGMLTFDERVLSIVWLVQGQARGQRPDCSREASNRNQLNLK
jgi:hypothetical protein